MKGIYASLHYIPQHKCLLDPRHLADIPTAIYDPVALRVGIGHLAGIEEWPEEEVDACYGGYTA